MPSSQAKCPKTVALLKSIPSQSRQLCSHRYHPEQLWFGTEDPYAGSLRYHWKDGEAMMFDETYIHFAANETDQQMIILFCDVERPVYTKVVELFNHWFGRYVMSAVSSQNV